MGVNVYNLVGFGIKVDKKTKIYDSQDAEYFEDEEPADVWTADLEKNGLKYYWSDFHSYVGIFSFSKACENSYYVSFNSEEFLDKMAEAENAFSKFSITNKIFSDKEVKFYATTLYR